MSFLTDYLTYTSGNEAPKLFHVWSGLSVLSSLVSRRVWLQQGIFTWYPNLYVVMVGEPGNGKSTALDIAKAVIRAQKDVPLAADAMTVQALLRHMSEEGSPCKKSFSLLCPHTQIVRRANPVEIIRCCCMLLAMSGVIQPRMLMYGPWIRSSPLFLVLTSCTSS